MSGEREIGITVAGLPADVVDLRITLEIDGQRKRVWRPAGANLRPLNLALPPDSSGQRLKVEILAYDEHCSVAVGQWKSGNLDRIVLDSARHGSAGIRPDGSLRERLVGKNSAQSTSDRSLVRVNRMADAS